MADSTPLTAEQILQPLEAWLEVEFTFLGANDIAEALSRLPREEQDFFLNRTQRVASINAHLAHKFAERAVAGLGHIDHEVIDAWALHAMDAYDRSGLYAAMHVINDAEHFVQASRARGAGAMFEHISGILLGFVRGLSGRELKLEQGDASYTDSETVYLPAAIARMEKAADNFVLAKAMVAYQWAQTRFGSFRVDITEALSAYENAQHALAQFHGLETLRLEACLQRELPGLYREMLRLKRALGETEGIPDVWKHFAAMLAAPDASVADSLRLLDAAYAAPPAPRVCYQGELRPDAVAKSRVARSAREKMQLRVKLKQMLEDLRQQGAALEAPQRIGVQQHLDDAAGLPGFDLTLDDVPVALPEGVKQLLTSVYLDFGEIPPDHLVPAGEGDYKLDQFEHRAKDPNEVWQGTYHEEGATLYPEWDHGRQHYRKNWCVMREQDVAPVHDDFVPQTLEKYSGLVKRLRRTFEAMRDEDRLLKRQADGDEVDFDALVEALADARDGSEMADRLQMRRQRAERNVAVMFMVDMSGSTKGWINDAEREALVLLAEALESLGDRYAIYGFSGITRKRCELFRIKRFDEPCGAEVRARISGIRPQDYTRMGFAIRHLGGLLNAVEARTKLLVTLSDGKPDDYLDRYRSIYGIEDTRQALIETKRLGIHPYCITLDKEGQEYLPHMYGAVNYAVIDEVNKLPLKVADIYRRLTTC
jgi:nitric oxide reductase NorD protein